ncbi:MAG: DUF5320 domain-containing protein [Candidatus Heimdallarchaeota archaeon]|nr:DUF5320 domain-containing protein [Candidatus Heimdallarchaeota archaeon]
MFKDRHNHIRRFERHRSHPTKFPGARWGPGLMGRPFGPPGFHAHHFNVIDEIADKDEAIEFLELQYKLLERERNDLTKRINNLQMLEDQLTEVIEEIGSIKDFSNDELKKILRKKHFTFLKEVLSDKE